jgi:hypothetical protein
MNRWPNGSDLIKILAGKASEEKHMSRKKRGQICPLFYTIFYMDELLFRNINIVNISFEIRHLQMGKCMHIA